MKKTTLICTLILVSLLSGCAGNNASQPVSSQDTSVTSSASESTTESITTPETSVPEESTSSYEDEKFTAIGVVDSSAEESKRDIASFIYDYGSEYKTPGKTTIDKMFSEALGDKIIDDEQVQKEVADILEKCGKLETELYNAGNKIKDMPDITAVGFSKVGGENHITACTGCLRIKHHISQFYVITVFIGFGTIIKAFTL